MVEPLCQGVGAGLPRVKERLGKARQRAGRSPQLAGLAPTGNLRARRFFYAPFLPQQTTINTIAFNRSQWS